jgi:hypothetical protein
VRLFCETPPAYYLNLGRDSREQTLAYRLQMPITQKLLDRDSILYR